MTNPVEAAFPARPLRITAPFPRWKAWLLALLGVVFLGGGGAAILWEDLPPLLSDHEIRARAVPLAKTRVVEGECRVRLLVLNQCRVTLAGPDGKGGVTERRVSYLFTDAPGVGDREVRPMGDPDRPELATTDLGLERFGNRVATMAGLLVALGALLAASLALPLIQGRHRRLAAAMSGRPLLPVPARVQVIEGQWIATPLAGGPKSGWGLGGRRKPFWLDPGAGVALAVTAPGAPLFPLDDGLTFLDLTEEERARLRAAVLNPAGFPPPGSAGPSGPSAA